MRQGIISACDELMYIHCIRSESYCCYKHSISTIVYVCVMLLQLSLLLLLVNLLHLDNPSYVSHLHVNSVKMRSISGKSRRGPQGAMDPACMSNSTEAQQCKSGPVKVQVYGLDLPLCIATRPSYTRYVESFQKLETFACE